MSTKMGKHHYFAEIIESSLTTWTAQSWQWDTFPAFGSLVTVNTKKRILFGIVYHISTGSMDPGRYPFAYQKTEEELLAEQPQIFEFLKTSFSCLSLGYQEHDQVIHQLAPEPPKIHAFVGPMAPLQYKQFFASTNYLHLLFGTPLPVNSDELFLAVLRTLSEHNLLTEEKLHESIELYSLLIGNDYRRLKLLLQRAQAVAPLCKVL